MSSDVQQVVDIIWHHDSSVLMHVASGLFRVQRQALFLDFGVVGVQLILGGSMYSRTIPEFNEAFQLDCLLKVTAVVTDVLGVPSRFFPVPMALLLQRRRRCVPSVFYIQRVMGVGASNPAPPRFRARTTCCCDV